MKRPVVSLAVLVVLIILGSVTCSAAIIRVKWDSPGPTFDGTSWQTAYHSVEAAVDAAVSGDEVWVAGDSAHPYLVTDVAIDCVMSLYGGFAGTETLRDQRDRCANVTILDEGPRQWSVIWIHNVNAATTVDGFTILHGSNGIECDDSSSVTITNNTISQAGVGISCNNSAAEIRSNSITENTSHGVRCGGSNPTIAGNTISQNGDGGIYCISSSPVISANTISGNDGMGIESTMGSPAISGNTVSGNAAEGIYCSSGSPTIRSNTVSANHRSGIIVSGDAADVSGNTIRGNTALGYGGGIWVLSSGSTISGNIIEQNTAGAGGSGGGGGICCSAAASITNNVIRGNSATEGGGIYCGSPSGTVSGNTIANNTASSRGAGIYCYDVNVTFSGNIIAGNACAGQGGGVYTNYSYSAYTNNTFVANTAVEGGAMYCGVAYGPSLFNNIIAFCSSGIYDADEQYAYDYYPAMSNNCVYGNTDGDYPGWTDQTNINGNISADPLLVDRTAGNYHLTQYSPCVHAGLGTATGLPATDIDGDPRVYGAAVDIGADEWYPPILTIGSAKAAPNGDIVTIRNAVVTAVFASQFYVETEDRAAGIAAYKSSHGMTVGTKVDVTGSAATNASGEKYINATALTPVGVGVIEPLLLPNRSIGGGDCLYNASTGAGQKGLRENRVFIENGTKVTRLVDLQDINTIGLLVTTTGKVTARGTNWFYLDDGSALKDNSTYVGIKVQTATGMTVPALNARVKVTGVGSCFKSGTDLYRLFRATQITPLIP